MCIHFRITAIEHGWIFGELHTPEEIINVANSYFGGAELPKMLFRALSAILSERADSEWICWHGESWCSIWNLQCSELGLKLRVFERDCSFGLPVWGEGLACKAGKAKRIAEVETDVYTFGMSVCDAFAAYSGETGKEKWQAFGVDVQFPEKEYRILCRQLGRR